MILFLGFHVTDKVQNTVGVSSLVIIPRNELDKVIRQGNTRLLVKDGRVSVTNEIRRHNIVIVISKNTSHFPLGCLFDGCTDCLVRSALFQASRQVDNRDIDSWHAERHSGKLSVEFRNDLTDGLGSTSRGRNDVVTSSASSTPVLLRWSIDSLLSGSDGVNSCHETLSQAEFVIDNLGKRGKAVGGARSVGYDIHGILVQLVIDSHDKHGCICGRSRDDNLLGTSIKVLSSLFQGSENTSRFDNIISSDIAPLDVGWIQFSKDLDGLAINMNGVGRLVVRHFLRSTSMHSVILVHVFHVVHRNEWIIHANDFNLWVLGGGAHYKTTDSAKAIDSNFDGRHGVAFQVDSSW
mmetsp:Transcript_21956/g.39853  ORF Transcript_21956/g.39853 Transcript_21956/m.39853 type:complete len:351 (-) Transcript_21956:47-1099(-)